jgi:capsid protein
MLARSWVDPQKEVNAAATARKEGFVTRSQVIAGKGGDFEENVIEIAQENEILAAHKVRLDGGADQPAKPAKPAKAEPPDDKEEDNDED